jgi:hypothetical protein
LHAKPCRQALQTKSSRLGPKPRARKAGFRPEIELFDSGDIVLMQGLLKDGALEGPLLVRNGYRSGRLQQRDRTLPTVGANADDGALAGRHGRQLLHGLTQNACSRGSAFHGSRQRLAKATHDSARLGLAHMLHLVGEDGHADQRREQNCYDPREQEGQRNDREKRERIFAGGTSCEADRNEACGFLS